MGKRKRNGQRSDLASERAAQYSLTSYDVDDRAFLVAERAYDLAYDKHVQSLENKAREKHAPELEELRVKLQKETEEKRRARPERMRLHEKVRLERMEKKKVKHRETKRADHERLRLAGELEGDLEYVSGPDSPYEEWCWEDSEYDEELDEAMLSDATEIEEPPAGEDFHLSDEFRASDNEDVTRRKFRGEVQRAHYDAEVKIRDQQRSTRDKFERAEEAVVSAEKKLTDTSAGAEACAADQVPLTTQYTGRWLLYANNFKSSTNYIKTGDCKPHTLDLFSTGADLLTSHASCPGRCKDNNKHRCGRLVLGGDQTFMIRISKQVKRLGNTRELKVLESESHERVGKGNLTVVGEKALRLTLYMREEGKEVRYAGIWEAREQVEWKARPKEPARSMSPKESMAMDFVEGRMGRWGW